MDRINAVYRELVQERTERIPLRTRTKDQQRTPALPLTAVRVNGIAKRTCRKAEVSHVGPLARHTPATTRVG